MDPFIREVGAPGGITNRLRPGPIRIISGAGAGSDSLLALAERRRHALSVLMVRTDSHPNSGNNDGGRPFQPFVDLRSGNYSGRALVWDNERALPTGGLHRSGDQHISSGLSEESITNSLKTRICQKVVVEEEDDDDDDDDCCVICMEVYQNEEKIGFLDCEHEYHAHCLKKWLLRKNICPICKAPAITSP